ncbi:MAG: helix-turn-helix domain-containing protein [Ilumatobacteraceae bacterium]
MTSTPTRTRILEAALELFNRDGYASTSQANIAAASGIRQGNLTYHFPAKMDLVEALRDEARSVLLERQSSGGQAMRSSTTWSTR